MATVTLTADSFERTVRENEFVLVDFWAVWCPPCLMFAPIFKSASRRHPEIVFGIVDTTAERGLAQAANITAIPTVMAYREGLLVYSQPGAMRGASLDALIASIGNLDMNETRKRISGQPAEPDRGKAL